MGKQDIKEPGDGARPHWPPGEGRELRVRVQQEDPTLGCKWSRQVFEEKGRALKEMMGLCVQVSGGCPSLRLLSPPDDLQCPFSLSERVLFAGHTMC